MRYFIQTIDSKRFLFASIFFHILVEKFFQKGIESPQPILFICNYNYLKEYTQMEEIIFPNKIRMIRRLRGLSMQELAKFLGISLSAVSKIEKGYRRIDQEQLVRICEFLNCNMGDVFISEEDDDDDGGVAGAWRRESERRANLNEQSGLKTLGAGLRHIRTQKGLTLADVADAAGMTLSVYHRIEMGQREISEDEFASIARAMGVTTNELVKDIHQLNESGNLDKFIQRNSDRMRSLTRPSGNPSDILNVGSAAYSSKLSQLHRAKVKVYGKPGKNGAILVDKSEELSTITSPIYFDNPAKIYGLNLCTRRLGNLLPTRAVLYVDSSQMVGLGDVAVLYDKDPSAGEAQTKLISIREDMNGKLYGVMWNPDEQVKLDQDNLSKLDRIIYISL